MTEKRQRATSSRTKRAKPKAKTPASACRWCGAAGPLASDDVCGPCSQLYPIPNEVQTPAPPAVQTAALEEQPPAPTDGGEHVRRAERYIDDVLTGRLPACSYVKAACARQRNDLARLKDHPIYVWDPERGARVCRFLERLPHVKGPKANAKERLKLEPWQCFIVMTAFGWRRRDTGGRRFKRVYIEVPRGNGKSALSSGIGLYCMAADGEQGADVYSAATTREQSKVVWDTARQMMQKAPDFATTLGVQLSQHSIYKLRTHSSFKALSREANNQDGLNVHAAIIDELHAHKNRETYDVIETATAKRSSSLIWVITTAGTDTSGICYEVRGYVRKILEGLEDDAQFGIIYTLDEGDAWDDPASWVKANPNWGVSVIPDTFSALAFKAMQTPSAQSNFQTKHLNVWTNADRAAFDLRAWDKCHDTDFKPEDFAGLECFVGLDLASKVDLAAKARIWRKVRQPDPAPESADVTTEAAPPKPIIHYYLTVDSFLPEAAIGDQRNASYAGWEIEGWLKTTPGDVLDFGAVKEAVQQDARDYAVREIAFDPWQATQLAQELTAEGLAMVEVRPSVQNFSAPMKELDALMREGRLHHDGNPVLRWMVSNVTAKEDFAGNIYPRKEKPENKIDGVVATLMALNRALVQPLPEPEKPLTIRFL